MTREQAFSLLKENLKNQNLVKHSLAVEAVMRGLAQHFGENEEKWGVTGLLHDVDYEMTKDNPKEHSLLGAKILEEKGIDNDICRAVKAHNEVHGIPLETLMDKALYVTDPLTGLVVAATLVLPSKKIADLEVASLLNRFKEKAFARGANREIMQKCQVYLNLTLADFFAIGLKSMQEIADRLGL